MRFCRGCMIWGRIAIPPNYEVWIFPLFDLVVLLVVWSYLVDFRSWRTEYLIVEITLDAAEVRYWCTSWGIVCWGNISWCILGNQSAEFDAPWIWQIKLICSKWLLVVCNFSLLCRLWIPTNKWCYKSCVIISVCFDWINHVLSSCLWFQVRRWGIPGSRWGGWRSQSGFAALPSPSSSLKRFKPVYAA
jgi:hypothetical protein